MADGRHVEIFSTDRPTGTQLGWSHSIVSPTCPPWCGCHGNSRCLATAHWTFCSCVPVMGIWRITKCTKFGQLILRKIIKIVATRCQILRLKCTQFDFGWGSAPDPARGAYIAPPDPVAGFKGASKGEGRGSKGDREGKEGIKKKERGGREKGRGGGGKTGMGGEV